MICGLRILLAAGACTSVVGCSWWQHPSPPPPTIGDVPPAIIERPHADRLQPSLPHVIAQYERVVRDTENHPLRRRALVRLGHLHMEAAQQDSEGPQGRDAAYHYRRAIDLYHQALQTGDADGDLLLYQIASAHDQLAEPANATRNLELLIHRYPRSPYRLEAQFRRAERLFVTGRYAEAERAYATIVRSGKASRFHQRALYKQGWCRFKRGDYVQGLDAFVGVLDGMLGKARKPAHAAASLSRGEQELVDDTLRVMALSLSYTGGQEALQQLFARVGPRAYGYRVYRAVGELYLRQQRIRDAADTFAAFTRTHPEHPKAPRFQIAVIEAYEQGGFESLARDGKRELIERYGQRITNAPPGSPQRPRLVERLKAALHDLAAHEQALARESKSATEHYLEAARWYRTYTELFPGQPETARVHLLLGQSLQDAGHPLRAARAYEKAAYRYGPHAAAAEAAYASVLAYRAHAQKSPLDERSAELEMVVQSQLRFAHRFPSDPRAASVLAKSGEELYEQGETDKAANAARQLLDHHPNAARKLRRSAWRILAHTRFEQARYGEAERAFIETRQLTAEDDTAARAQLADHIAACVYRQGERLRDRGETRAAIAQFLRVAQVAPGSYVRPTAEFDAAAGLIQLQDWKAAIQVLERFRAQHPQHRLQSEVTRKLAVAYVEAGRPGHAAREFAAIAATDADADADLRHEAAWRAAELYQHAGSPEKAARAYQHFIEIHPGAGAQGIEARYRIAEIYRKHHDPANERHWLRALVRIEGNLGEARTQRTRVLAGRASLRLARAAHRRFSAQSLSVPLKASLRRKRQHLQRALEHYQQAARYNVAEITTQATYRMGELYGELAKSLLASERPQGLNAKEIAQYDVLLEEQAFPFEERAIEIHRVNAQRAAQGIYGTWVRKSFERLARLQPVRYAKRERLEKATNVLR